MVRVSGRLADYEHDRCKRERLFLSALFPAAATSACVDRRFRRAMAERTSAMEKFVDSASAVRSAACWSSAKDALSVLVQLYAHGRGQNDLSGKFLRGNAGVRDAHRTSHIIGATRVRFWRRA